MPIPDMVAGVCEARSIDNDADARMYIGKAGDLRLRVRHGLVKASCRTLGAGVSVSRGTYRG